MRFSRISVKQVTRMLFVALLFSFVTLRTPAEPPGSPKGEKAPESAFDQTSADHDLRYPLFSGLMVLVVGVGGLLLFKLFLGQTGRNRRR